MIIDQKLAKNSFLAVYYNNLDIKQKAGQPLEGYLARGFEVQISYQ
jgi:hypothetical protein